MDRELLDILEWPRFERPVPVYVQNERERYIPSIIQEQDIFSVNPTTFKVTRYAASKGYGLGAYTGGSKRLFASPEKALQDAYWEYCTYTAKCLGAKHRLMETKMDEWL